MSFESIVRPIIEAQRLVHKRTGKLVDLAIVVDAETYRLIVAERSNHALMTPPSPGDRLEVYPHTWIVCAELPSRNADLYRLAQANTELALDNMHLRERIAELEEHGATVH